MTLFAAAATGPAGDPFRFALARYYDGLPDPLTLRLLGRPGADAQHQG
jgi:hypothetical protein